MQTENEAQKWLSGKSELLMVAVRLPKVFIKAGKRIAKEEGITFSHWMRRCCSREFLSQKEKQP